jgi:penicillin-binding protein 1C
MKTALTTRRGSALLALAFLAPLSVIGLLATWPVSVPAFSEVRAAYIPSDAWLLDRHGALIDSRRVRFDVRRLEWVPLTAVSPALLNAIIAGEDRRFWQHRGIDWRAVLGAARDQLWRHERRGASTITMQLASLLSHHRGGGRLAAWAAKFEQVRTARALERHWSKSQILEAYLNLLQYQGEFQGIGAAAAQLTGKPPSGLSAAESLLLAALLPQPGAQPQRVISRACARAGALRTPPDCSAIRAAAEGVFAGEHAVAGVHLAPQLAQTLLQHPGDKVRVSLDAGLQRFATESVRAHLQTLASRNVRDGAALIVENATGEILAYVASGGAQSRAPAVDGVQAARQAGSTLKPFLYELALERRYLTAASLLDDSPISLETASGVYIPQDYDHDFKGLVSVRTALAGSLNVPAVRALVLVGVESFRTRLYELGYTGIRQSGEYYGYSLALGSAEVTLWQQAQAYRALARGGKWSVLTLAPGGDASSGTTLLMPQASFIVADVLSDPAARAVTFGLDNHLDTGFWSAAKTGTSEDMRDNWCIGFSRQYTVAVWVGNFEGDSMHAVSGVSGAAPIWHDLMSELHRELHSTQGPAPAGVSAVMTRFSPSVEPQRSEWYLDETAGGTRTVAALPASALPRIESPANGVIIAIDPDIPAQFQRVLIEVHGAQPRMRLKLNGQVLGPAIRQRLWAPRAGRYQLTLEDAAGQPLDRVLFAVRGTGESAALESRDTSH